MKRFEIAESDSRLITNNVELMQMTRLENWYFANYVPPEKAHTSRAKAGDFDCFATFCGEVLGKPWPRMLLADVTEATVRSWQDWMIEKVRYAPATVNRRVATIRHLCSVVKERVPSWHNPFSTISDLPTEVEYRAIPAEKVDALIAAAYSLALPKQPGASFYNGRSGLAVEIPILTGMRSFEVLGLTVGHVSKDLRWFVSVRVKGGRYQNKYIPERLQDSLQAWLPFRDEVLERHYPAYRKMSVAERAGTPLLPTLSREDSLPREMNYKAHYKIFRAAAEIVDAGPFATHRARHSFCEAMTEAHKDPFLVAQAAGHSDPKTTFRYSQRSRDKLGSAIEEATRARRKG
jgi:integrase